MRGQQLSEWIQAELSETVKGIFIKLQNYLWKFICLPFHLEYGFLDSLGDGARATLLINCPQTRLTLPGGVKGLGDGLCHYLNEDEKVLPTRGSRGAYTSMALEAAVSSNSRSPAQ